MEKNLIPLGLRFCGRLPQQFSPRKTQAGRCKTTKVSWQLLTVSLTAQPKIVIFASYRSEEDGECVKRRQISQRPSLLYRKRPEGEEERATAAVSLPHFLTITRERGLQKPHNIPLFTLLFSFFFLQTFFSLSFSPSKSHQVMEIPTL